MGIALNLKPNFKQSYKLAHSLRFIDIDFETRCEIDIREVGAWVYSEHPSCKILLMSWCIDGGPINPWRYGEPIPKGILRALKKGYLIRAHNSFFEYCIWNHVAVPKLNWPALDISRFYCTQALATAMSYKPKLGDCGENMHLWVQKDPEGKRLIQKFSIPSRKKGIDWNEPEDYPEEFNKFDGYCHDDVATQIAVANHTKILSDVEHKVFILTEKMNVRGLPIDVPMVKGAIILIEEFIKEANKEAKKIVGDAFETLTQTAKVKDWLNANGCRIDNMQKDTIERKLKKPGGMPKKTLRILKLRYQASKSSTAKYHAAMNKLGRDNAVHESLKYHIAQTGRWGGRGLQIQNFVKPTLPKGTDYDYLCELITNHDYAHIESLYGDVMQALSSAVRSMIKAPEGYEFISTDFSQIEPRVLFWFVNERKSLNMFKSGEDLYCDMASAIYGRKITKKNEFERSVGKAAVLGLGYQMGAKKFKNDIYKKADIEITLAFAEKIVDTYRKKYKKVRSAWYELDKAALKAMHNPGRRSYALTNRVYYYYNGKNLTVTLPSGRKITYIEPRTKWELPPWGGETLYEKIIYMGVSGDGAKKWSEQQFYGGRAFNHIVQGSAREIMATGMLNAENYGYTQIATIHDEAIAMVPTGFGSVEEYEKLLVARDAWAMPIPVVAADGYIGNRFRK